MAMLWDFGSAVSSQQQAAGDHVQRAASRGPQQQKHPQHPQQRQQAGQELVPWIPTNPDGMMHRLVDNHYAMDPMRRSFDRGRSNQPREVQTGRRPMRCQMEMFSTLTMNGSDARKCCSSQVASEKKPAESTTNLYRAS